MKAQVARLSFAHLIALPFQQQSQQPTDWPFVVDDQRGMRRVRSIGCHRPPLVGMISLTGCRSDHIVLSSASKAPGYDGAPLRLWSLGLTCRTLIIFSPASPPNGSNAAESRTASDSSNASQVDEMEGCPCPVIYPFTEALPSAFLGCRSSKATFNCSTLTRGSPKMPHCGGSTNFSTSALTCSSTMPRAAATRAI